MEIIRTDPCWQTEGLRMSADVNHGMRPTDSAAELPPGASSPVAGQVIEQAEAAFARDLPQLVRQHLHQWVAYHGAKQLGFAPSRAELHTECLRRGLSPDELVVWQIEPVLGTMIVGLTAKG
jgi:hypothetical protein